ncbi:tumor necrosis factor receptor superfamily member 26-like isoform X2 [Camelus ferus]|uniref:Tumor necrosis factor receptor superfamily member 26-like isoform X2 n=1 Tax=Camelus ferus TaxID=419612 RepID=A0A8B8TVY3_CAMFR|nr:tumor necrosis factor receptor superfamily member 26-like isoform X2 [Camelus ferus]
MTWWLLVVVLPLLLLAQVTMTTRETLCDPGYYLTEQFQEGRSVRACRKCESGTFRSHPSAETSCVHCALCRDDQEVVTECSPTSDRQCQCKEGHFYCDSGSCTESCFRCKRCEGSTVLHPCNATRDTVCATESNPKPGTSSCSWPLLVVLALTLAFAINAFILIPCIRTILHNHSKKGNHGHINPGENKITAASGAQERGTGARGSSWGGASHLKHSYTHFLTRGPFMPLISGPPASGSRTHRT